MTSKRRLQLSAAEASILEVRQRASVWARQVYGPGAEKSLQRDFDISESSAERVLRGQASQPIINQMLAKWGWRAAQFILEPLCGTVDPIALHRRIQATEQKATDALRESAELRRTLASLGSGDPQLDRGPGDQPGAVAQRVSQSADRPPVANSNDRLWLALVASSGRRFPAVRR